MLAILVVQYFCVWWGLESTYNSKRWITRLVGRWRTQPAALINVNCRTHWSSTLWTHIAALGHSQSYACLRVGKLISRHDSFFVAQDWLWEVVARAILCVSMATPDLRARGFERLSLRGACASVWWTFGSTSCLAHSLRLRFVIVISMHSFVERVLVSFWGIFAFMCFFQRCV